MWRLTNILLVFVLLQLIHCEFVKQKVLYAYKGKVLVKNVASDKLASIWTISGILSVEDLNDQITFKLDGVKTRIFNGDPVNLIQSHEKEISEKMHIVQEPFVVYPGNKSGYNITHKPDEPIWSLNMKRSIASIFFLNTDRKTNSIVNETTIYGDCEVKYKVANNESIIIWKIFDSKGCENSPVYEDSNVGKAPTSKDFEPIKTDNKRIYYFDDLESLRKIEAISTIVYQSMPSVKSKQIIEQSQEFNQISNTTTFDPVNISELTNTSTIIFDNSEDDTNIILREINNMTDNKLIDFYKTNYNIFKEHFEENPFMNDDAVTDTTRMFYALEQMNEKTLLRLQKKIFKQDDTFLANIFVSYLPYLGTNESLQYIKNLVQKDDVIKDLYVLQLLAILPSYINDLSEETVEQMEGLLHLENVENNQVRYAAYLCFANIVSNVNKNGALSSEKLQKYISIYADVLKDAENYETQMAILLSYVNMANGMALESVFEFITNNEYSRHIRVLAAYGFKEHLMNEAPSEVYGNLWPIVKNSTEPFEVRVACLDIILYTEITEDQFKNIVQWYKDELREPSEQHLANYMYTTLKALQNTTGYHEYHGDLAAETLAKMKPLKISNAWSTGNYRMAYTDSGANFGASFQARLISNPITHVVNSAFFTVDSFAHSFQLGRYSLYIKAEGIADKIFSKFAIEKEDEMSVPKLLKLIQKNAYLIKKTDNIHIDLVIFSNNQAIYSMHISRDNVINYATNPLFEELLSLLNGYNGLSYPISNYNYLVSDLGTRLTISTDVVNFDTYILKGFQELAKSSSSSEEDDVVDCTVFYNNLWYYILNVGSYNPLLETSISTFKEITDQKLINIPFAFNLTSMLFQWKHNKDAFAMSGDHLIGTYVEDEDVLYEHCVKCSNYEIANTDEWKNYILRRSLFWQVTGVTFNITYTDDDQAGLNFMNPKETGNLLDIMEHHQSITFDNVAKPFLLLDHYLMYNKYINHDLFRYSVRSMPFYDEDLTESFIEVSFNTDDNTNDEHPIAREDLNMSIALTTRKQNDADILGYGNVTFKYFSDSETNSSDIQPHIHHKYDIELAMSNALESPIKACIDRDVHYPSRRTNKFSLDSIDSAWAITTIAFGDVQNVTSECPDGAKFYIKDIYSASEKQKTQMIASPEYKNCKEQSKNLKYIPPTDDCLASHEMISKYEICDIYGDSINPPSRSSEERTEHGVHIVRYTQINETNSKLTFIHKNISAKLVEKQELLRKILTDYLPLMTLNPRVVAYDEDDLEWGISSSCFITSNRVRTFTGHTLKKYYEVSGEDTVAFVECTNTSTKGMTIQKYGDKYVGFHFYSFNETIVVSVPNNDGKLKILFNDEIITKTNRKVNSDYFEFYFLDDDVIFISSPFIKIYYTGEYIQLEVLTIYNNYICGLCSETQHF